MVTIKFGGINGHTLSDLESLCSNGNAKRGGVLCFQLRYVIQLLSTPSTSRAFWDVVRELSYVVSNH